MEHNDDIYAARLKVEAGASRGLAVAAGMTLAVFALELVGGFLTHSLALLADAGHMATDVFALGLSYLAVWFSKKPATPERTYGFYRVEILAALVNGVSLCLISIVICYEAYARLLPSAIPVSIDAAGMFGYGAAGLAANVASAVFLRSSSDKSVNVKAAYLHVLSDLFGSVGVLLAAAVIALTGWTLVDPILSVFISVLIVRSAWGVIAESVDVLLESVPKGINPAAVESAIRRIDHVVDLHDFHIWSITSGVNALSCHIVIDEYECSQDLILNINKELKEKFDIAHVTIQLENKTVRAAMREDCDEADTPRPQAIHAGHSH